MKQLRNDAIYIFFLKRAIFQVSESPFYRLFSHCPKHDNQSEAYYKPRKSKS